ncbi:hypothetical protein FUAX_02170 [Fulvitalea axinellae]|uniref:OmpR/PhoB-type domain-containing protein n=1 Tax=Fulvitalea axinellae TaxID=1182444 RepID=A0AAU9D6I5_9BACT|nr:hypothetical protein FUAX_02170 [Fulvitalea axinellae]
MEEEYELAKACLDRIKRSRPFFRSAVCKDLIDYLVRAGLRGESPKELQLAVEALGKKAEADKDLNVRPYISKVRKKLDEYYRNEGRHDEIRFEIPKGQYGVVFHRKEVVNTGQPNPKRRILPFVLGFGLTAIIIAVFVSLNNNETPLFAKFSESDRPTAIILGNPFFASGKLANGNRAVVRIPSVNGEKDLAEYNSKQTGKEALLKKSGARYLSRQSAIGMFHITQHLRTETGLELRYASSTAWEDAVGKNVIFVGSTRTLGIFRKLTEKIGFAYHPPNWEVNNGQETLSFPNRRQTHPKTEHVAVFRLTTPDQRHVLFFFSDNGLGNAGVLRSLTDAERLKQFRQEGFQDERPNFRALFEVKGQGFQEFDVSLKHFSEIKTPAENLWP